MTTVNMLEAKTHLSRLAEAVDSGQEAEVVIARNGHPVARLVPYSRPKPASLVGIARGKFRFDQGVFDDADDQIATLFAIPPLEELPRP